MECLVFSVFINIQHDKLLFRFIFEEKFSEFLNFLLKIGLLSLI